MSRGPIAVLAAAVCASLVLLRAQQQPPPRYTERVDVSNIVVDARVLDALGAPLLGLTAPDFFVTVGRRPAKVQLVVWTGASAPSAELRPLDLTSRTTVPAAGEPGELIVLLFQKSLTREHARGLIRMVEQSRSLVRDLPPSARVAILMFDSRLRIWSDFTNDRDALDRILAHGLLHEQPPRSVIRGTPSLRDALPPGTARVTTIERAFEVIGQGLEPLAGSKAIAYIGHGFGEAPFGARPDAGPARAAFGAQPQDLSGGGEMNNEYRRAWRALTTARVSVFSLDTTNADIHTLATGMHIIAESTGGFYASSLDFPEKPLRLFAGAVTGHYVLFVEPPPDAADRSINVSVNNPKAAVFATSSYRSSEK